MYWKIKQSRQCSLNNLLRKTTSLTICLVCKQLWEVNHWINFNCIEERWQSWISDFEQRKPILPSNKCWGAVYSRGVQVIRNCGSIPILPIQRNVEYPGLIGLPLYNFSKVHVGIKLESGILSIYKELHWFAFIRRNACSLHNSWWRLQIIVTLRVNGLCSTYVCPLVEMVRTPETIKNIIRIPEAFSW